MENNKLNQFKALIESLLINRQNTFRNSHNFVELVIQSRFMALYSELCFHLDNYYNKDNVTIEILGEFDEIEISLKYHSYADHARQIVIEIPRTATYIRINRVVDGLRAKITEEPIKSKFV
jgi:hypothetical protein